MRTKIFVLPLLVLFLTSMVAPVAVSAAVPNPTQVGQVGGVTNTVVFSGGRLYFNVGPRIVRMTVPAATPGQPTRPGAYSDILPGIPEDIRVANGYIYVAMGYAGIAIMDTTTMRVVNTRQLPSPPPISGSQATPPSSGMSPMRVASPGSPEQVPNSSFASAVAVSSQRLYVAAGRAGVIVYALGPDKKELILSETKTFSPALNVTDVETISAGVGTATEESLFVSANNFAAAPAGRGGVLKFDITTSPTLGTPSKTREQVDVNALYLKSSFVYAAGEDTFYVFDKDLGTPGGAASQLALANPAVGVALGPGGSTAYLMSVAGVYVVDLSAPAAPVMKSTTPFVTQGYVRGLAAADFAGNPNTFLYLAASDAGLSIASAPQATPKDLALVSSGYVTPRPAIARVVAGAFRQAFVVSNSATLWTINSADAAALSVVGSGIALPSAVENLATYQDLLVASAGESGLLFYRINPGAEPTSLGSFPTNGAAHETAIYWPHAVVALGTNGLAVVTIEGTMELTGTVPAPELGSDFRLVEVQGNYAYVGDNNGTFRIYDLTDPSLPVARGTLTQTGMLDLKVSGPYAFLACGARGIRVVDIRNPDAPVLIDADDYDTPDVAQGLALYQNYLFVTDGGSGVHMLAIQPSGELRPAFTVHTSGTAVQLAIVSGDYLYVADENGGLVVIRALPFELQLPMILRLAR